MSESSVTSKGQVTVPVDVRRELGIRPGGKVRFVRRGRSVYIEAVEQPQIGSLFGILRAPKGRGFKSLADAIEAAKRSRVAAGRRRTA
ncbi:MAG: AbrB/MazE/SpoVT family DNA-binding domain-containing protein [Acidobacteria bacterium]|nr:AbrB/MazE/SpoVT family DNA-binding domain-containing protein [Acidobacteriota bacterium]